MENIHYISKPNEKTYDNPPNHHPKPTLEEGKISKDRMMDVGPMTWDEANGEATQQADLDKNQYKRKEMPSNHDKNSKENTIKLTQAETKNSNPSNDSKDNEAKSSTVI